MSVLEQRGDLSSDEDPAREPYEVEVVPITPQMPIVPIWLRVLLLVLVLATAALYGSFAFAVLDGAATGRLAIHAVVNVVASYMTVIALQLLFPAGMRVRISRQHSS